MLHKKGIAAAMLFLWSAGSRPACPPIPRRFAAAPRGTGERIPPPRLREPPSVGLRPPKNEGKIHPTFCPHDQIIKTGELEEDQRQLYDFLVKHGKGEMPTREFVARFLSHQ